jgi:hypothetical protein
MQELNKMITKKLKDYEFYFENKVLKLYNKHTEETFVLDKVRMLSLMRFMIRVMQHLSVQHHAKNTK